MNGQRSLARPRTEDGRGPGPGDGRSIECALQQTLEDLSVVGAMGTQPSIPLTQAAVRAKHSPCPDVRFDDHAAAIKTDQTYKALINQGADHPLKLTGWEPGSVAGYPFSINRHWPPQARGIGLAGTKIPRSRHQLRLLGVFGSGSLCATRLVNLSSFTADGESPLTDNSRRPADMTPSRRSPTQGPPPARRPPPSNAAITSSTGTPSGAPSGAPRNPSSRR